MLIGEDSAVISFLKRIVFFCYAFALLLFPLIFIKPKWYFGLSILLLPFALADLYALFISGTQSTAMHYMAVFSTNFDEAKELMAGNILLLFLALTYILIYVFLFFKLDKKLTLNRLSKYLIAIFSFTMIIGLFVRDYAIAKKTGQTVESFETALGFFEVKLDKTFPFGAINKLGGVLDGLIEKSKFNDNNRDFSYQAAIENKSNKTLVLVIGEAARKHNFQLYGYERPTNPLLSSSKNLLVYSDFTTNANFTQTSFPQIVTSIGPKQYGKRYNEKGIIAAFNEAGYQTYWITNQPYYPNSLYYLYAKNADYYLDVSTTFEMKSYDDKVFPFFEKILSDSHKKRLIIIHSIGSHYRYNLRYPKAFELFNPVLDGSVSVGGNSAEYKERYVNSYDNSILYTDYFLSELINRMKELKEPGLMMYVSDHGENLYDDEKALFLHGSAEPSKYELEIPFFIWTSDNYDTSQVKKLKALRAKKLSSEIVFHTLTHLGGFTTNLHKTEFDLLSDSLTSGNRLFLLGNGQVISIDK